MINYYNSEIVQILPDNIAKSPEVSAVSYAISRATAALVAFSKYTGVFAEIESVPEKILDLLAVELRAPYYLETMKIEQKRQIIKNSILWYRKAGTPYAVNELITVVFGQGEVKEWFEYGGRPYTFKIKTDTLVTEDIIKHFNKIIGSVKNTRSHMEAIEVKRKYRDNLYTGGSFKMVYKGPAIREDGV